MDVPAGRTVTGGEGSGTVNLNEGAVGVALSVGLWARGTEGKLDTNALSKKLRIDGACIDGLAGVWSAGGDAGGGCAGALFELLQVVLMG